MTDHPHRRRLRIGGALLAAVAVIGTGSLAAPAYGAAGCQVTYTVNDWGSGFTTDIAVTNLGAPLTQWSVEFDFAGNQQANVAWNAVMTQSGKHLTLRNAAWNGNLPTDGSTQIGFLGSYSGANAVPERFQLNGVVCNEPTPEPMPTHEEPFIIPKGREGNPYASGKAYVNPEWKAKAQSVPGGERIADTPTAVWLDDIASIEGRDSSGAKVRMGLRDHLDEAVAQDAGHIQLVLYNLPGRRCGDPDDNELEPTEIGRYWREFIDPIVAVLDEPKYRALVVIAIVEPHSLSDLVANATGANGTYLCSIMARNGNYQKGIAYALGRLGKRHHVYTYLDGANYHDVGWASVRSEYVAMITEVERATPGWRYEPPGLVINAAGYAATEEPFLDPTVMMFRSARWVDWNDFADQLSYVKVLRRELVAAGWPMVGVVIDTSRNGWGGPKRPTSAAPKPVFGDVDRYVNASRIDRRYFAQNWCNQEEAGLGERPAVDPVDGIDAFAWVKPPGESDGPSKVADPSRRVHMCDPDYSGTGGSNRRTGAMADAPARGEWFPEHLVRLMRNAYPPL
ncbi:MAG TPA: glycoside hydrolase family 6 protein [Actinoplanes sp.]|nr:glycoside hydrolase family 6 protein [Actinoplanes sp.]